MDTETIIPVDDSNEKIIAEIPDMSEDDGACLMTYLIVDKELQEIFQLFELFRYNLDKLLCEYEIDISGSFVRKTNNNQYSDFISINALTMNYVSASKTLITAMEAFEKLFADDKETEFKIKYTKKAYDKYFSYRLMEMVRNCSQHGTLPVSLLDNKLSFDIEQLLNLLHFNYKKSFETELLKLRDEVVMKFGTPFKIAYMYCISEYNYVVSELYYDFLGHIKKYLNEISERKIKTLKRNPKLYVKDAIGFRYGGVIHIMAVDSDILGFAKKCKEKANEIRKKEKEEWFSKRKIFRENIKNSK